MAQAFDVTPVDPASKSRPPPTVLDIEAADARADHAEQNAQERADKAARALAPTYEEIVAEWNRLTNAVVSAIGKLTLGQAGYVESQLAKELRDRPDETRWARMERLAKTKAAYAKDARAGSAEAKIEHALHMEVYKLAGEYTLSEKNFQALIENIHEHQFAGRRDLADRLTDQIAQHIAANEIAIGHDPHYLKMRTPDALTEKAVERWVNLTPIERGQIKYEISERAEWADISDVVERYEGAEKEATDKAWAAGLTAQQRANFMISAASIVTDRSATTGEKDQNRDMIMALAPHRISDSEISAIRHEVDSLHLKIVEMTATHAEIVRAHDLDRMARWADDVNRAMIAAGVDLTAKDIGDLPSLDSERAKSNAHRASDIVRAGEKVFPKRDTADWKRAWEGLRDHLVMSGLGDGTDLDQASQASEGWMMMGSYRDGDSLAHTFRHREHPYTGQKEYVAVLPGPDRNLGQEAREPQLER